MVATSIGYVLVDMWNNILLFLPNLINAMILLVIGLVLGKIIGRIVKEVLVRARFDYYITETEKPVISLTALFSTIIRWWIYLIFITESVSTLGLPILVLWVGNIIGFIPNVIGATLIVVAGYVLGDYIKNQMKKVKDINAAIVGKVLFFLIVYVSVAMALPILGISATLINNILLVVIGSVGLGLALAIGLGMKDAVSIISQKYAKKLRL